MTENWTDIRHLKIPKRYKTTQGKPAEYWSAIARDYYNFKKQVDNSGYHWYVITYKDGRTELAYFKVRRLVFPHGGTLCRGLLIHRFWDIRKYEHTKSIRLAF